MYHGECTRCRKFNAIDAIFCSYCGAPIYYVCSICKEEEPVMFTNKRLCRKQIREHKAAFLKEGAGYFTGDRGYKLMSLIFLFTAIFAFLLNTFWMVPFALIFLLIMYLIEKVMASRADKKFSKLFPEEASLLASDRMLATVDRKTALWYFFHS